MATRTTKRRLTEEELNNPDLDDDGNLDVEHYLLPDGSGIQDPYLREVWNAAVASINSADSPDEQEGEVGPDDRRRPIYPAQKPKKESSMKKAKRRRSSYLSVPQTIQLSNVPVTIWGYDTSENFVCRLEINAAGIAVYSGTKGGKQLRNVTWENLVEALK